MLKVLIFSTDPEEVRAYKKLLDRALPEMQIHMATTFEEAAPVIADIDILFGWMFPRGLIAQAKSLKWIHKVSAGVEDVVADPGRHAAIRLSRSNGAAIAPRMVEYVLAGIYLTTQKLMTAIEQKHSKTWKFYSIGRASGRTVGVAGLGDIGMEIATGLHRNGMRVLGWRRTGGTSAAGIERIFAGRSQLEDFVSRCDFVVSVLPATEETRNIFDEKVFAAMRKGAVFINIGRGASVKEEALAAAILGGHLGGAILDVFHEEPLPASSPLWDLDEIVITPHVSGPIIPEDILPHFLENVRRFQAGERLLKEVDFDRGY